MRVLVIEDDEELAETVAAGLREARMAVDVALDGEAGLARAFLHDYEVIVLDRDLPVVHGDEVCAKLVAAGGRSRVLMLTGAAENEDLIDGLGLGADDYLTKPFAFAELIMRVKALLRRGPVTRSSVLRVADLEVDRFSQQVRRAGKRIDLTPKEYALLEYLAANPGRVFSRTMIIEHVWDQSFEGLTNIVDVYVRHLRGKVDDPFPVKLIRTVRGVGYGLAEGPAE